MEAVAADWAVWLYGSVSRGDADASSDIDLLVLGDMDDRDLQNLVARNPLLKQQVESGADLAPIRFSWDEAEQMASYGSLFFHHVRSEGQMLEACDNGRSTGLLDQLCPYQRGQAEMKCFRTVLVDVARALGRDHSPAFELSVIATALRHAFILGCYVQREPTFGRVTPFHQLASELGLDAERVEQLGRLYDFRLHQYGRAQLPFAPDTEDALAWLEVADDLLTRIGRLVDVFYTTMP